MMRKSLVLGAPLMLSAAMFLTPVNAQQLPTSDARGVQVAQKDGDGGKGDGKKGGSGAGAAAGSQSGGGKGGDRAGSGGRGGGAGVRVEGGARGRAEGSGGGGRGGRAEGGRSDGGVRIVVPTNRSGDGIRRGDGRNRGVRHSWGPGAVFYFYDGYYHGDCGWVRRKAISTGSRYWWNRFRQCRAYN